MSSRDYKAVFKNNFLTSVSCEIRFPPLLIIKEKIGEFQKEIRKEFPKHTKGFMLPKEFDFNEWSFISEDEKNTLRVFTDRFSIITKSYNNFKPFYDMVYNTINKFIKTFKEIDALTRIGLRYINEISLNSKNPIEDIMKWFNPLIYNNKIKESKPIGFSVEFRVPNGSNIITCRNTFPIDKPPIYIIDTDSYTNRDIKIGNHPSILTELHDLAIIEFHNNVKDEFLEILRGEKELV